MKEADNMEEKQQVKTPTHQKRLKEAPHQE